MDTHKNPNLQTITDHHHRYHRHLPQSDINRNTTTNTIGSVSLVSGGVNTGSGRSTTITPPLPPPAEESTRERLKKHRMEMAGRVWIPDTWGQEDLLKDWTDCTVFDASLKKNTIMSARTALVQQARSTVRIGNRC